METKTCIRCLTEKPTAEFYKNTKSSDGLQSYCIECSKIIDRERRERAKNSPNAGLSIRPAMEGWILNRSLKNDPSNPLAGFMPRQLMAELKRRGFVGELSIVSKIDITKI